MDVFDLVAKIKLDSNEYEKGLSDASMQTDSFASVLGAGLTAAASVAIATITAVAAATYEAVEGMWEFANEVAEFGDKVDKNSQKLGMSTEAYQKWDYVLKLSGSSIDKAGTGIKTLTNQVDSAIGGSEEAVARFEKLGISIEQLGEMSREDVFEAVINGLQGMEESTERAALANDLLGRSGQDLTPLLNMTAEATQNLLDEAEQYGIVMSEESVKSSAAFEDALTRLEGTANGLKNSIGAELLPAFTDIIDGFSGLVAGVDGADEKILSGAEGLIEGIGNIAEKVFDLVPQYLDRVLEIAPKVMTTLVTGLMTKIPDILIAGYEIFNQMVGSMVEVMPMIFETGVGAVLSMIDGISDSLPSLIPAIIEVIVTITQALVDNIDEILRAAEILIIALSEGLMDSLPILIDAIPPLIGGLMYAIYRSSFDLLSAAAQLVVVLAGGIIAAIPTLLAAVPKLFIELYKAIGKYIKEFPEMGMQMVNGLMDGFLRMIPNLVQNVNNAISSVVGGVKDLLGIHSPSKVFAGIGGFMAEGLEDGWSDEIDGVRDTIEDGLHFEADSNFGVNGSASSGGFAGININVYGAVGQSEEELAEIVSRKLAQQVNRERVVFA